MTSERLNKLRALMQEQQMEALLITHPTNRRYLTGFTGTAGVVVMTADEAVLVTDFRYTNQAKEQAPHVTVVEYKDSLIAAVRDMLLAWGIAHVGFEKQHLVYGTYESYEEQLKPLTLEPTDGLVEQLRLIKDDAELQVIRDAAKLADDAFAYILNEVKPGVSERQLALKLEMFMRERGATSSSFEIIVASGERSALPHGVASERLLQPNEFVKFDFGALYDGYCSDLTRTVVLGTAGEKHRYIYDIVLEAQMHALEHLRPGMTGKEADALTRDVIKRYGYGDYFGHATGHGFGMDIHEQPRLSAASDIILQPGMTVTVEPGIYIPNFGGVRIEDDVVMTDSGIERLTFAPKQLICID